MQDRAIQTRQRILKGAATVIDRRGFAAATLDEIMIEAQASKGALYFHFRGKDELARAILAEDDRWARLFDLLVSDAPMQDIIDVTQALARALRSDPMLRASYRMAIEYGTFDDPSEFTTYDLWSARLAEAFERAGTAGDLRPGLSVPDAVGFLVASFTGMQVVSQVVSQRADLADRLASWWTIALPGLTSVGEQRTYLVHGSPALDATVESTMAS